MALIGFLILNRIPLKEKSGDWLFLLRLWALTFLTWNAQEIPIYNNFVIGNIPPNYEFIPYSDANEKRDLETKKDFSLFFLVKGKLVFICQLKTLYHIFQMGAM